MSLAQLLKWSARISSIIVLALLIQFAFSGGKAPTTNEIISLAFFPVGMCIGLIIAWWREGLGGLISIASLAAFYAWMFIASGNVQLGPYFLLFTFPAFLFVASWVSSRTAKKSDSIA